MLGMSSISPILPLYAQSFHVNVALIGLVITIFGLARMISDLPAGYLSEHLGRGNIIRIGILIIGVGSILCGISSSFLELIIFRFIVGIGSAIFITSAMTAIADFSGEDNRGRTMSLYNGSILIGTSIGPGIGGFIAYYFGLRSPFFFHASLSLIALLISKKLDTIDRRKHIDGYNLSSIKSLIMSSDFLLISLIIFIIFFTRTGSRMNIIPLFCYNSLNLNEIEIGFALSVVAILNFVTLYLSGYVTDRFGRKIVIIPSIILVGLSLILVGNSKNYLELIIISVFLGIGEGLAGPAPAAYTIDISPNGSYGITMGLYRTFGDMGFVLGPLILGFIADKISYSASLNFNATILFIISLLFWLFAKERKVKGNEKILY